MSQRDDLKLLCENAVGFSDVSLAPDVVLGLLAELDVSNNVGRALGETLESVCESRDALARVVEQMKVEVEALRKDAERYRWLASKAELESYGGSEYCLPLVDAWNYKPGPQLNERFENLDAAIDAAIIQGEMP